MSIPDVTSQIPINFFSGTKLEYQALARKDSKPEDKQKVAGLFPPRPRGTPLHFEKLKGTELEEFKSLWNERTSQFNQGQPINDISKTKRLLTLCNMINFYERDLMTEEQKQEAKKKREEKKSSSKSPSPKSNSDEDSDDDDAMEVAAGDDFKHIWGRYFPSGTEIAFKLP